MSIFKTETLFGSKTRANLLALFLLNEETAYFVRELARAVDAQLNSIRRELKNLVELGLVLELDSPETDTQSKRLADKKKFYGVNKNHLLFADLRSVFKKADLLHKRAFLDDLVVEGGVLYAALTGSFIDNPDLPTDILIIGKVDADKVRKAVLQLEQEVGHELNYTVINPEEAAYRKHVMDRFLLSLIDAPNIVLVDEWTNL